MSTNADNGYGWKPRKTLTLECPTGQKVIVQRPGPEIFLKTGRVLRGFARKAGLTEEQAQQAMAKDLADMSDEELALSMQVGREWVVAMLVSPRLVINPQPESDEIGPDDLHFQDYWFLFSFAMDGFMGIKIPVGDTEVEVADLESFRSESIVSRDSVDGQDIRPATEQAAGDQRSVGSP